MEFKKGSKYTRDQIHTLYFDKPVPRVGTGNWTSGYVRVENELIVFMNIDVAGTTGHDFPNRYDPSNKTIVWYGKPGTDSQQPTFQKLINKELTPHFFARWDNQDPSFIYLGIGKIVTYEDGHPTTTRDGIPKECVEVTLTCDDSEEILLRRDGELPQTTFAMEKYLEEFIIGNWNSIEIGKDYDLHEQEIDGKRKKFRTDTGEIDIFAIRKDRTEYLVIELKKGRASDKVIGQITRYMGYIKYEIAKNNEKVKGLIIALEDDLGLRRSLSIHPDIDFRRYEIQFNLKKC